MYLYISSLGFVVGHKDDHVQSVDHPLAPCLHGARLRFSQRVISGHLVASHVCET